MFVPAPGTEVERKKVINTHPEYEKHRLAYRLYRDCLEADGGFAPVLKRIRKDQTEMDARGYLEAVEKSGEVETYLVPYAREHAEDFKDRLEQAHLPNFVKHRGISPLSGFLCEKKPDRQHHPTEFEDFCKEATTDGAEYDNWMADEGIPYGMAYGTFPMVIDSDPHSAQTEDERMKQGAEFAKMRAIHPDNMLDWFRDKNGKLQSIKYLAKVDIGNIQDGHKIIDRYCYVTPEGWWTVDDVKDPGVSQNMLQVGASDEWPWAKTGEDAKPVLDKNGKPIKRAPLVELRFFNGQSLLHDIVHTVKRFFNMLSEDGDLERKQIPIFYAPQDDSGQGGTAKAYGLSNWWPVPEGGVPPGWASPDSGCLTHYVKFIEVFVEWIQEMLGTASIFSSGAEAAATLAYRFQCTEKMLKRMAASLERFELDVAEVVMLWHGQALSEEITTKYTHSFDVVAAERFLDQATRLKQDVGTVPTGAAEIEKRAFELVMGEVEEETWEKMKLEWGLKVEEAANPDAEPDEVAGASDDVIPPAKVEVPGGGVNA